MNAPEPLGRIRELSFPLYPIPTGVAPRLPGQRGIRAVLFDVYGTLLVSASGEVGTAGASAPEGGACGGRGDALRQTLLSCGMAALDRGADPVGEVIRRRHAAARERGVLYPEVEIRSVFRELLGDARVSDGELERLAIEYECRANPTWQMPHASEAIRALGGAGLELGIVSNAQFMTPLVLEALLGAGLQQLGFDAELCVWSYLLGEAKPSARLHREALERLGRRGIRAHDILFVGNDRRNDIAPAASVGMRTALYAGDARSYRPRPEERIPVTPDLLLTDLRQLPLVLGIEGQRSRAPHLPEHER